jgi:hypothetical protein
MIDTRIIRKDDGKQYVQIIKGTHLIDELPLAAWCELSAVRHAMEIAVECAPKSSLYC